MQNSQLTADLIKQKAKSKGISISKLLLECELNKNSIYTMQSSGYYPRVEALIKIADYLDCSIDYLLGRTDNPNMNNISIDSSNIVNGNNGNNSPLTINNKQESISQDDTEILKLIKKLPLKKRIDFISMLYNELGEE